MFPGAVSPWAVVEGAVTGAPGPNLSSQNSAWPAIQGQQVTAPFSLTRYKMKGLSVPQASDSWGQTK